MSFLLDLVRNFIDTMLQLLSFGKKKIKNTLNIYVKSSNATLSIDLSPQMEIKELKEMVAGKLGLEANEMKIIFAGKELLDSTVISVSKIIDLMNFMLI